MFGLVNVPVRVDSAVHEHKPQFHLVHEPDNRPIGYEKICKLEDKPVSSDEVVKAFEYLHRPHQQRICLLAALRRSNEGWLASGSS